MAAEPSAGSAPADAGRGGESAARSTGLALATQLTTATFTAVLTIYLVRALGPAAYGTFALAVAITAIVLLPSDFGVSASVARFVAEARGDPGRVSRVMAVALRLKLLIAVAVSIGLAFAAAPIASAYGAPELEWPLRGVALALLGQSTMMMYTAAFVAMRRVSVTLRIVLSESAMETLASIALVMLGAGATGAAFGRGAGYVFGALIGVVMAVRFLGWGAIAGGKKGGGGTLRQIAGYAGALLIIDGAFTVLSHIDGLIIGAFLTTAAVGLYSAPGRLVVLLHYPGLAVANGVAPRMARGSDEGPQVGVLSAALRYLVILQAAMVAPILVWAGPIVDLVLGPGYEESADVLRALTPYVFLAGLAPLVSLAVNFLGEARRRIPIALAAVAVNVAIDVTLIPRIGIVAGAIGTDVAYLGYVAAHLWILRRLVGMALRPLLLTMGRALLAATAMAVPLFMAGTSALALPVAFAAASVGAVAFAAVLIGTGEVSPSELRRAASAIRARLPRSSP